MSQQEKEPSIEIGYVEEKKEEEYGFTKWFTYSALIVALIIAIVSGIASYIYNSNATKAINEANKAKQQVQQVNSSTGAKIEKLVNTIADNKQQWETLEARQEQLNASTTNSENELAKYNISVIQ